jgi:AbrB family looped-hinge helix DNA binding protein
MKRATISSKNQVVIPREVRQALGVKAGDEVIFVVRNGSALLLESPKSYRSAIRGLARKTDPSGYLKKERASWD